TSAHSTTYVATWVKGVGNAGLIASTAHVFRAAEVILSVLQSPPTIAVTPQIHNGAMNPEPELALT
ncbi:MAG: hypothetical protein ACRDWV_10245, partial [Acidimicrobiales bacterium]